jgi:hypothetical protein
MTFSDQYSIPFSRKSLLSTLWIFVLMNMIYADILGMLKPGYLDQLERLSTELTPSSVLTFSILMEIPIAMILLSRILNYRANRWANLIAAPLAILWVVVPALMPSLGESTPISYMFFATIEVITMTIIFRLAWTWPQPKMKQAA